MNPKPLGVSRAASDAQPASGVSENLLRMVFDCAPVGIAVLEIGDGRLGCVLAANQELCKLLGYDHDNVIGEPLEVLFEGIGAAATTTIGPPMLGEVEHQHFEECLRRDDGDLTFLAIDARRVECADESESLAVVAIRDATDIHDLAARFAFVADHDLLTALLNRRGFETRLVEALARSVRYGDTGAVVVLDLDRFKEVNDTNGHAAGDAVLQAIAEVLRKRLRTTDLVARIGGDEFAVMIGHVDREGALNTVDELLEQIRERIATMPGAAAEVTVSAGIAAFDKEHPTTVALIMEAADAALDEAKRSGRAQAALAPQTSVETA
jgi:diguanylate cyclase (GGDEF)-like protein/PAS domain S-box-containing protein